MFSRKDILSIKAQSDNPLDRERVAAILKKSEVFTGLMPRSALAFLARDENPRTALSIASNGKALEMLDNDTIKLLIRNPKTALAVVSNIKSADGFEKSMARDLIRNKSSPVVYAALERQDITRRFSDTTLVDIVSPITKNILDAFSSGNNAAINEIWPAYNAILNNKELITILPKSMVIDLFIVGQKENSLGNRAFKKIAKILVEQAEGESKTAYFDRAHKLLSGADMSSDTGPVQKEIQRRVAKLRRF